MSETFYKTLPSPRRQPYGVMPPGAIPAQPINCYLQPPIYVDPSLSAPHAAADAQVVGKELEKKLDLEAIKGMSIKLIDGKVEIDGFFDAVKGRVPVKGDEGIDWIEVPTVEGIQELNEKLDAINEDVQSINTTIENVTNQIDDLEHEFTLVETTLVQVDETIGSINSKIGTIESSINTLNEALNDKVSTTDFNLAISDIRTALSEVDIQIEALKDDVEDIKDTMLTKDDEFIIYGGNADTNKWEET